MSDAPKIARLPHNQYASDIKALLQARADKKAADAAARKADGLIKTLRAVLFQALDGAPVGRCGNAVLTLKPERHNPGSLTLLDGRAIPLSQVSEIVFTDASGRPDVVSAREVAKWYGGATIGADLEITLTGDAI